jgi:hypothetical protein
MELTKEIIKELGWEYRSSFFWELPWNTDCDEISNRGLSWRLNFVSSDKTLHIDAYERNSFEWERIYAGPCNTKQDLIDIMKLLKLHQKSELYTEKAPRPWEDNKTFWDRITDD